MIPKNTEVQINSLRRNVERPKKPGLIENVKKYRVSFGVNHILYQRINEISGRKLGCSGSSCIKAKEGTMLVEKNDIKNR